MWPEKMMVRFASVFMLLWLSACGGPQPRDDVDIGTAKAPPTQYHKPALVQKRGGGYYKDDGPGDEIQDNLDDIPDASPKDEPLHRFANRPYVVLGKSFVPKTQIKPFQQRGIASWYGKKFHGQKTSIGEPYDMFSMTAAHPTLAIPSYVRVTNVRNKKSVVLRVTDRGPFHADRIIDLSYAAAYRLGYIDQGSTQVEVEAVLPDAKMLTNSVQTAPATTKTYPALAPDEIEVLASKLAENGLPSATVQTASFSGSMPPERKGLYIQLGAFSNAENAENLRSHLSQDLDWLHEPIEVNSGGEIYRVQLGPYANRSDSEKISERIRKALGYKPVFATR